MVLPAVTRMVMSLMFTPSSLARLARNCARRAPAKSVESPAMVKVAETTSTADAPGGGLGGGGRGGGEGGGGEGGGDGEVGSVDTQGGGDGEGGGGVGSDGGDGQVKTVPSTSVRVVGQEQTLPPKTPTLGPPALAVFP